MLDILIRGGSVIDGTGASARRADVAIRGDRIEAVEPLPHASARVVLDATGNTVAPGLIDAHVHGDLALFTDPLHEPAIRQGVTTYLLGQDGVAMAPASRRVLEYMCRYTAGFSGGREWMENETRSWSSVAEYLDEFDGASAVNAATLVPNGNVRLEAMGLETRPPTEEEMRVMRRLVREGMEQGACGLSSGLDYIPSRYASEAELAELCEEIAPFGGVYVTHMRRYDPEGVLSSMDDVFGIGRSARCPVHISHFNSRAGLVLPKLDEADATFDLYCYLAGSSILGMYCLPPWAQEGGIDATVQRLETERERLREWFTEQRTLLETVRLSYIAAPEWKRYEGMRLPEDMGEFVCEVLIASRMAVGCVVPHRRRGEEDIVALMRDHRMLGGSDGIFTGSKPHPRGCGCFARYLGHYVRNGTWSLETAVARLSGNTARRFGLRDRGELRKGMAADVIVFDAARIADRSTYDDGAALAEGMEQVLVNGVPVLLDGMRTQATPGRGLRRG